MFIEVFAFLARRKYALVCPCIALLFTVVGTNSPTNGQSLCGAPEPIYGVVSVERFGMRLPVSTRVELRTFEGDLVGVARSNPFGWYEFADVLPCQDYSVRAMHKRLVFAPSPILAAEFDGKGVRRDVFEIVPGFRQR